MQGALNINTKPTFAEKFKLLRLLLVKNIYGEV